MSRPTGTADELERRRKRAVQAVAAGESRATVAKVLGVHYKTVARWVRAGRRPGGLDAKPQPGPTPGLTDADLERLAGLLAKGAKAHGWHTELWTAARVARLIDRVFHRSYHPEHVREILRRRLGWTSQKPRRKPRERDDREVSRWLGDEFPRIVREAFRRRAYLVFLDESGFFLTPTVRRTLAPRGKTPVLDAWDRWSAISCITLSPVAGRPGLYFDLVDHNVRGPDVVRFLAGLHRRLGSLTVVWDRNRIHSRAKVVGAWLADHPGVVAEDFLAADRLSKLGPVAVLDLDVHHGNGTQHLFYHRADVLTVSVHGDPEFLFPYFSGFDDETGTGPGLGFNRNLPLPPGTGERKYRPALETALEVVAGFRPAFVVVSFGVDSHEADPIGGFRLPTESFAKMGAGVRQLGVPAVVVQEGGYNRDVLGACAAEFLAALEGER